MSEMSSLDEATNEQSKMKQLLRQIRSQKSEQYLVEIKEMICVATSSLPI
jgi:hypothetical protein